MLALTACAPAALPVTPTLPPSPTPRPSPTLAPAAPAIPPTPTPQTGCTSSALFVTDVTVLDMSSLGAGEAFTKTWRLKNTGTCTWNQSYHLVFAGGDRMQAPASTPLAETAPGGTLDLSVDMFAPALDGIYTGLFELRDPAGDIVPVGTVESIWVKIVVGTVLPTPVPGAASISGTAAPCKPVRDSALTAELFFLINQARADAKLPALTLDSRLTAAAQAHSEDMACNNFRSHTGSNGSSISMRVANQGYAGSCVLETIYSGGGAQSAFNWWMNDQLHRDALLDPNLAEVGIGHAYTSTSLYGDYIAVDLASP